MEDKPKKTNGFAGMLLTVLLIAAAILAVTLAVRSRQEGGIRAMWRSITGRDTAREFFFESASGGDVADLEDGVAVAATSGLYVYDSAGELLFNKLYTYRTPALSVAGRYGACCSVGGSGVMFFTKDGVIKELSSEKSITSATVTEAGYLTVCTDDSGYMGTATVYNSLGTAIYRWRAGNARILLGRVRGHEDLTILTVGEGGSRLVKLRLDSEDMQGEFIDRGLIVDFAYTSRGYTVITTDGIIGLDESLGESWTWDFGGRFLEGYSFDGDTLSLTLSNYQVGGGSTVYSLTADGVERGSVTLTDDFLAMDARDGRIAVLTPGLVTLYDPDLKRLRDYEADPGAVRTELRAEGSVLCSGTFSAYVYGG